MLRSACLRRKVVITGVIREQMVRDRLSELVQFNAHADLIAIRQSFRLFFIYLIRLYKFQRKRVMKVITAMLDDENLTITRQTLNNHLLHVDPGHLPVRRAVPLAPPSLKTLFNSTVPWLI